MVARYEGKTELSGNIKAVSWRQRTNQLGREGLDHHNNHSEHQFRVESGSYMRVNTVVANSTSTLLVIYTGDVCRAALNNSN